MNTSLKPSWLCSWVRERCPHLWLISLLAGSRVTLQALFVPVGQPLSPLDRTSIFQYAISDSFLSVSTLSISSSIDFLHSSCSRFSSSTSLSCQEAAPLSLKTDTIAQQLFLRFPDTFADTEIVHHRDSAC